MGCSGKRLRLVYPAFAAHAYFFREVEAFFDHFNRDRPFFPTPFAPSVASFISHLARAGGTPSARAVSIGVGNRDVIFVLLLIGVQPYFTPQRRLFQVLLRHAPHPLEFCRGGTRLNSPSLLYSNSFSEKSRASSGFTRAGLSSAFMKAFHRAGAATNTAICGSTSRLNDFLMATFRVAYQIRFQSKPVSPACSVPSRPSRCTLCYTCFPFSHFGNYLPIDKLTRICYLRPFSNDDAARTIGPGFPLTAFSCLSDRNTGGNRIRRNPYKTNDGGTF
jgi:hypothetical protein